MNQKVGNWSK